MTNKEFLVEVQKSCQLDMPTCLSLMGSLQKMLAKAAIDQVPVYLRGLGVFNSHKHPEYVQENQQTGIMTLYPPRISFRMQSGEFEDVDSGVQLLAEYAKIPESQSQSFIEAFVATIQSQLPSGDEIDVPGIGIFQNIMTHHSDMQHVAYVPSDQMKEQVNAPFSCFEPIEIGKKEEKEVVAVEAPVVEIPVVEEPIVKETVAEESFADEPVTIETVKEKNEIKEPQEPSNVNPNDNNQKKEITMKKYEKYYMTEEEDEEPESSGNNKFLYVALAVVLLACGGLAWLIFSDNDDDVWDNIPVAKVVEPEVVEDPVLELAPEDTMALENEIEEEFAEVVPAAEPAESKPVAEETAPVKSEPAKAEPVKAEPVKAEPVKTAEPVKPAQTSTDKSGMHRMMGADGKPVTVVLQQGERLTLIAEKHFGNKAFWPYIFDANSDKLKSPNNVPAGMTLYLPDPAHYGIDAKSSESIRKANNRGAQLLK